MPSVSSLWQLPITTPHLPITTPCPHHHPMSLSPPYVPFPFPSHHTTNQSRSFAAMAFILSLLPYFFGSPFSPLLTYFISSPFFYIADSPSHASCLLHCYNIIFLSSPPNFHHLQESPCCSILAAKHRKKPDMSRRL